MAWSMGSITTGFRHLVYGREHLHSKQKVDIVFPLQIQATA